MLTATDLWSWPWLIGVGSGPRNHYQWVLTNFAPSTRPTLKMHRKPMLNAAVNWWTDKVYHTSNGNWDSGQKGPKAAGRCACRAVKPWRPLSEAPSLLKQIWSPLMASKNSIFLQNGQGITKRNCLEARAPPHIGGCTGVFLRVHACLSVSLLWEEVSPSGAAFFLFQIMSEASRLLWECILPCLRKILSDFWGSNAHLPGNPRFNKKICQNSTWCIPEVEKNLRESSLMMAGVRKGGAGAGWEEHSTMFGGYGGWRNE